MPAPEVAWRYQDAVLWAFVADGADSEPVVSPGVDVKVRWTEGRREAVGPDGNTIALDATAVVALDVAPRSVMWKGKLADFDPTRADNELWRVATFKNVPDVKGRVARREAGLQRFRGSLPVIQS
jgi:hypothetical protein